MKTVVVLVAAAVAFVACVAALPQGGRRPGRQQFGQDGQFEQNGQDGQFGQDGQRQEWGWPGGQQQQRPSTTPAPADGVLTVLPANCQCTALEQYNPVCGSDGNTYQNRQKLNCFAACGTRVTYVRLGVCKRRQDVPT